MKADTIYSIGIPVRAAVVISLVLGLVFSGCGPNVKPGPFPDATNFLFITPAQEDSLESLAQKHLGDSGLSWRIREFNGIDKVVPGESLIIPLRPVRPGGLTASGYQTVPVLAYHQLSKQNSNRLLITGAEKFQSQLEYLKNQGFHGINLKQLREFLEFGQVPEKSVLITLDDGWESAYSIGYPILKNSGFSAVLFIPTNSIGLNNRKTLDWDQIREMVQDESVDIQLQAKTTRNMTRIRPNESFASYIKALQSELKGAEKAIHEKIGTETNSLSYPYGMTNMLVVALARAEGYSTAFTVHREGNPFFQNPLRLNRSMIFGRYTEKDLSRNLKIFEPYSLDKVEPVDQSLLLSNLDYQHPMTYETKEQWRTAAIAWKMHRDWLVGRIHSLVANSEDLPEKEISALMKKVKQADLKIISLTEKLKGIAAEHYRKALANSDNQARQRGLLKTLLYDPIHQEAIAGLRDAMQEERPISYKVRTGENTLEKVAVSVYKDKRKSIVIPLFNARIQKDEDLRPGIVLQLPRLPKRVKIAPQVTVKAQPSGQTTCGVNLGGHSNTEKSSEYYVQAVKYFDKSQVNGALASLETALCLDSGNKEAKEMKELIQGLSAIQ